MFEITCGSQLVYCTRDRETAVKTVRHFRRIERSLGRNLPCVMERVW